jgi:hypothetical protein
LLRWLADPQRKALPKDNAWYVPAGRSDRAIDISLVNGFCAFPYTTIWHSIGIPFFEKTAAHEVQKSTDGY